LSSLYTAFGIMQDDNKEERSEMEVWRKSLLESDAALAKEQAIQEANKFDASEANQQREMESEHQTTTHHKRERGHRRTVKKGSRITNMIEPSHSLERATVATGNEPFAKGVLLLLIDNEGKPLPPNKISSPSTPRQRSFLGKKTTPSTSDVSNKLKKQFCVLHGANGLYQLRYGDSYSGPVSGVHEFITAGVSSVEVSRLICSLFHCSKKLIHLCRIQHTPRSSCQQFGFEIVINPSIIDSPSLCCVAETESEFLMWMSALTSAMEISIDGQNETALVQFPTEHHQSPRLPDSCA
jgi:hypothetical protein